MGVVRNKILLNGLRSHGSGVGVYQLTVRNVGAASNSGTTTVTDVLPGGLTPRDAGGGGFACSVTVQGVTCTHDRRRRVREQRYSAAAWTRSCRYDKIRS